MTIANIAANVSPGHAFAAQQVPRIDATSTFDFTLYQVTDTIVQVVKGLQKDDPHLYLLTLLAINLIPDPEWRQDRLEELDEELHSYDISGGEIDFKDVRAHIACIHMLGNVTDWQAQYRMTVRHNLIGSE